MTQVKLAALWAAAILGSAFASSLGVIGADFAEGLYLGLLIGAGASLGQSARLGC